MKSMAKAVVSVMNIQKTCGDEYNWDCNNNAVALVSAFADMATFILGAVSHCSRIQMEVGIACAGAVTGLTAKLLDVSKASSAIAAHCVAGPTPTAAPGPAPTILIPTPVPTPVTEQPTILVPTPVPTPVTQQPTILVPTPVPTPVPAPRLYAAEDGAVESAPEDNKATTFALVALLPITAIVSFFGGVRYVRRSVAFATVSQEEAREIVQ
jgi:hypothetical protein